MNEEIFGFRIRGFWIDVESMNELEIEESHEGFCARAILKLIEALPNTRTGRCHSADQLGRAASSVAANYRAGLSRKVTQPI